MSFAPKPAGNETELVSMDSSSGRFVVRCECSRSWCVTMHHDITGKPGFIMCLCGIELIAWSGAGTFTAALAGGLDHSDCAIL